MEILDENRNRILTIKGPCIIFDGACCPCNNTFKVLGTDRIGIIGKIRKVYCGFIKEMMTDADNFSIEFPADLSINAKSTLVAALFLIDFMFFENNND